jgi:hypothetical protein
MNFTGYILQVLGLVIGFFGTLLLTLNEIKTTKEIGDVAGTYADENPYLKKELKQRSQFAKILATILTVSFAFQLIGLALS